MKRSIQGLVLSALAALICSCATVKIPRPPMPDGSVAKVSRAKKSKVLFAPMSVLPGPTGFRITSISRDSGVVAITWAGEIQLGQLQRSSDFKKWVNIGDPAKLVAYDTNPPSPSFYRVLARPDDGNSTNYHRIRPGAINWYWHDNRPGAEVGFAPIAADITARMTNASYGRNWLVPIFSSSCQGWWCGRGAVVYATNEIHYTGYCTNCYLYPGADTSTIWHEMVHVLASAGEGHSCDANGDMIALYGDDYDPLGTNNSQRPASATSENMNFIGLYSRKAIQVHTNGTAEYVIPNMETVGGCVKVLRDQLINYFSDGVYVVNDRRNFYYVELRPNHRFSNLSIGPAVQIRHCTPPYLNQNPCCSGNFIQQYWFSTIGDRGGLKSGMSWTGKQTLSTSVGVHPTNTVTRLVTFTVLSCDTNSARVRISIQ